MGLWIHTLQKAAQTGRPSVAVTVAAAKGSSPREAGAAMVVTPERVFGTIGGGALEFQAMEQARRMIGPDSNAGAVSRVQRCVLGPEMRQCCGGVVYLHYESVSGAAAGWLPELLRHEATGEGVVLASRVGGASATSSIISASMDRTTVAGQQPDPGVIELALSMLRSSAEASLARLWPSEDAAVDDPTTTAWLLRRLSPGDFRIVLFGAGHVGRALVPVLAPLADQIDWYDPRESEFPDRIAPTVRTHLADPFRLIELSPPATYYLVMTYSHALDLALCESVLQRSDFRYLGLIGSISKRNRFRRLLREEGVPGHRIARMTCPIGNGRIKGKTPAAIAVSAAAELLELRERQDVD